MKKIEVVEMLINQKISDLKKYKPYGNELALDALDDIMVQVVSLIEDDDCVE